MDLQEIEKHIDKSTGLVPIVIIEPYAPYMAGQIAGFPPAAAVMHINQAIGRLPTRAERRAKPEDQLPDPPPVHGGEGELRANAYDRRPEIAPRAQTAPGPGGGIRPPAAIPTDWQNLGTAERRKLAADLSGIRYQELSGERADEIIKQHVDYAASDAARAAPSHAAVPSAVLTSADVPTGGNGNGGAAQEA